jgi:hypothetical protein
MITIYEKWIVEIYFYLVYPDPVIMLGFDCRPAGLGDHP